MLLRVSGQQEQLEVDVTSVTAQDVDAGVPHSDHLRVLTEATIRGDWLDLGALRQQAEAALGSQKTVDALVVAAAFNGITRVADAIGIPLDKTTAERTETMRSETGIDRFAYAEKSAQYDLSPTRIV